MGATKTVAKTKMSASESRAHNAAHKEKKEKHRHSETNRKLRVNEKMLDLKQAQFELDTERKAKLDDERRQRQAEQVERQQEKDAQTAERQARRSKVQKNTQIIRGVSDAVNGLTPDHRNQSWTLGNTNWSLGMIFLVLLVLFWLTLNKAPKHSDSRMSVMLKAIVGKEKIV